MDPFIIADTFQFNAAQLMAGSAAIILGYFSLIGWIKIIFAAGDVEDPEKARIEAERAAYFARYKVNLPR